MKLKRVLSLLATMTALALTMTACGGSSGGNSDTSSSGDAGADAAVQLNILQFKVEINDQLTKAIEDYKSVKPNVTIGLETVGGGDDYGAVLRTKYNESLTIFNLGGPQDVKDWDGKVEDLSDQPWVSNAVEGTLGAVTKDDKVYGLPYAVEGYGLIYNKKIFEAAGIDGASLDTYAKIEAAFKTLKTKIDAGELKEEFPRLEAVTELPAKETWVTGLHGLNVAMNQEFGSVMDAFEAPTVEFKHQDALKKYFDLQVDYSANAGNKGLLNSVDYATQVNGGLAIERVAVIQQGNWIYGDVNGIDPTVAENLGILPTPLEGVKEDSIPVGVPMYWAVNSQASDPEKVAAKEFLNWLYQSEEGKKIVVEEFGFIPPFTNYENLTPSDVLGQSIKTYAEAGKVSEWTFMGFPTGWGQDVFGAGFQGYLNGDKTFDELVAEAKASWESSRK